MKNEYQTKPHCKFRLTAHIIFVVKYRKNLMGEYGNDIKGLMIRAADSKRFKLLNMEVDKNHIHILVDFEPNCSIGYIVKTLKAYSTTHIWQIHEKSLRKHFWKKGIFWTHGYFACTVGDASRKTLEYYIENQG